MGLFDLFSRHAECPVCGDRQAVKSLFGRVRCPNRSCSLFDDSLHWQREESLTTRGSETGPVERVYRNPRTGEAVPLRMPAVPFEPGAETIGITYTNYKGETKTFVGARRSLRRENQHFSVCVQPSGQRIALAYDRIVNVEQIAELASRNPSRHQLAIMRYHRAHGTTSELFEQLERAFPDW